MTEERRSQLQEIAAKGIRAQRFLDSDFWKQDLEPYFKAREKSLQLANSEAPGNILRNQEHGIMEKIAITVSLNTGQLSFLIAILHEIRIWISEGEAKRKELEESYAKKT